VLQTMQDVAQLVERLTVDQVVVGSNPIILPSGEPAVRGRLWFENFFIRIVDEKQMRAVSSIRQSS
jgi:hypothetical protein